jgi:autotransporter-associated beta strand protein
LYATPATRIFYQASAGAGNTTGLQSAVVSIKAWDRTNEAANGSVVDTRSTFLPIDTGFSAVAGASNVDILSLPRRRLLVDVGYDSAMKKEIVFIDNSVPWMPRVINQWSDWAGYDISALAVSPDESRLYAASFGDGLLIIDISDAYAPRLIARVEKRLNNARDICVTADGRNVLLADEHTVWVADVSNPLSVTWSSLQPQTSNRRYHRIQVSHDGLVAFAARFENGGVDVLDISIKDKPRLVTALTSTPTWALAAAPNGRTAYVGDGSNLTIFDTSTPASPRLVATLSMPAAIGSISALSDGRTVLATCGALGVQAVEVVGGAARLLGSIAGTANVTHLVASYDNDSLLTLGGGGDYGNSWRTYSLRDRSSYSAQAVAVDALVKSTEPSRTISIIDGQTAVDPNTTSGTEVIVKRGGGVLILDKPNSHAGGTVVEAGEVIIRNPAALGTGALEVRAGAKVTLDVNGANASVGVLSLSDGGLIDFGYGRLTIAANGFSLPVVISTLRAGYERGWSGTDRFASRNVAALNGGGLGYVVNDDGSLTFGFAASGDSNLDDVVDILDVSAMLASGKFNSSESASWSEGDFNYDGVIDILDISDVLGASLFNAGIYVPIESPEAQIQPQATSSGLSVTDAAFVALATESSTLSGSTSVKKRRLIKQHPFCKSGVLEVGHLASMVR